MKTIEEKNRMIAKFMGVKYTYDKKEGAYYDAKTGELIGIEFKYHASWNWLMPVIEKIETELNYEVQIHRISCQVNIIGDEDNELSRWVCGSPKLKLKTTYETICQFIEWYNENKQP